MRKLGRIILYALFVTGFLVGVDTNQHTPYVAWRLDLHHLSLTFAFLCAAACGVMWDRTF